MSEDHVIPRPAFSQASESELESMPDEQVFAHMAYWDARTKQHRALAARFPEGDQRGYYDSFSSWWCSKNASKSWRVLISRGLVPDPRESSGGAGGTP